MFTEKQTQTLFFSHLLRYRRLMQADPGEDVSWEIAQEEEVLIALGAVLELPHDAVGKGTTSSGWLPLVDEDFLPRWDLLGKEQKNEYN